MEDAKTPAMSNGSIGERQLVVDRHLVTLRQAEPQDVVDLRHRVLRAGLPRESAVFPGDELSTGRHFGAFVENAIICCATFHREPWQNERAWRLRGMATDEAFRGRGIGRALLAFAEEQLWAEAAIPLLWCNARVPAARFYQAQGWEIVSDVFDIPTAGPHYRMVKRRPVDVTMRA